MLGLGLRLGLAQRISAAVSAYASYALGDAFARTTYWQRAANSGSTGAQYASPSLEAGYSFAQSGTCYETNADGSLAGPFAANAPALTTRGYMARQSLTNLFLNSATGVTQDITVTAQVYTLSFLGTGTITLSGVSTAGPLVGTGAGNRVSLTFTPTAGTLSLTVSGSCTNVSLLAGNAAGPYIPTTGATATRGLPTFTHRIFADNSALTDQDMIIMGRGTLDETVGGYLVHLDDGTANNQVFLTLNGNPGCQIYVAGVRVVNHSNGSVPAIAGLDTIYVLLRSSGTWRWGVYRSGTLSWTQAAATTAFPTGMTRIGIGNTTTGGNAAFRGAVASVAIIPGTFANDAAVIAAVTAGVL